MGLAASIGRLVDLPKMIESQFLKLFHVKMHEYKTEDLFFIIQKKGDKIEISQVVKGKIQPEKLQALEIETILTQQ